MKPYTNIYAVRHRHNEAVWLGRDGKIRDLPALLIGFDSAEKWREDFAQVRADWVIIHVVLSFENLDSPTTKVIPTADGGGG